MSHAGSDAVFDFLRVCSHGFRFKFGVRVPASAQNAPPNRSNALYVRIQAASPPPSRVDKLPWEFGIRVNDGTEAGQPLQVAVGDDSWKQDGVFQVKGIPSLDQPASDDIVLDRWLTVPGHPTTLEFNGNVDHLGFLSASYRSPSSTSAVWRRSLSTTTVRTISPGPVTSQSIAGWRSALTASGRPNVRASNTSRRSGTATPPHD